MLGQVTTSDTFLFIESKVQSKVAEFLLCKEKLTRLQLSIDPEVKDEANTLMAVQLKIEEELSKVLDLIKKIKTSGWSTSDIAYLVSFYYTMERHVGDVEDLTKKAGGLPATPSIPWTTLMVAGGVVALVALLTRRR